jgi:uncharacterized membrane protein YtjA (UPF0391 family)
MSELQFEETSSDFPINRISDEYTDSKMINFLIKRGIVKGRNQAVKVLFVIAIVLILLSIFFSMLAYKKISISPDDARFKFNEEQIMTFPAQMQEQLKTNKMVK